MIEHMIGLIGLMNAEMQENQENIQDQDQEEEADQIEIEDVVSNILLSIAEKEVIPETEDKEALHLAEVVVILEDKNTQEVVQVQAKRVIIHIDSKD